MTNLRKGDLLTCEVCGLVVAVDEACGCAIGEIICCKKKPMVKGKAAALKAKKNKAAAKTVAKTPAKKAVKGKPVVKSRKKPAAKAKNKK